MSVYTVVEREQLERFLDRYDVGALRAFSGIEAGIENTNYFVTTTAGEFVLTLFEFTAAEDLGFFLDLMAYLAEHGIASAHPVAGRDGRYLAELNERPAALVVRLPGASVARPGLAHCRAIGEAMAQMHRAVAGFIPARANDRGRDWRAVTAAALAGRLDAAESRLLEQVLAEADIDRDTTLPHGIIHADLFRDNALFAHDVLTGIIDFYYAHSGPFVYDLAVTVADWCHVAHGRFDAAHAAALLAAYDAVRPLQPDERAAWPAAVRAAGARFWLSRLHDLHFPRAGALTHVKDPMPFRHVLEFGLAHGDALMAVWPRQEKGDMPLL